MPQRQIIAWDIETCPQPLETMSERQRRRYRMEYAREARRDPSRSVGEISRLVRSVHPFLGWICCISLVRLIEGGEGAEDQVRPAYSFVASCMEDERELVLTAFWEAVTRVPYGRGESVWVTFNGKRFDADFLTTRTLAHGLEPTRRDLLDTYPFRQQPHCDLARAFDKRVGLDDVCDLVGVESPKASMHGGEVWRYVEEGRVAEVAAYCEADVVATLDCYRAMRGVVA